MENSKTTQGAQLEKAVFLVSLATSLFLLAIYLNYSVFQSDFVLIGVFQELLTIPCFLAQPVLLILAGRTFIKSKFKFQTFSFVSLLIVVPTLLLAWGSLIF